jgi:predicted nucleic acid-binding protein
VTGFTFDTNIVRLWYAKNPVVTGKILSIPSGSNLYISAVSIGEIEFGHLSVRAIDKVKQADFRRWISQTFDPHLLDITHSTAQEYAKLRRYICDNYYKKSKYIELYEDAQANILGIDENDLWLVAQAYEHNLTFVTNDKMFRIKEVLGHMIDVETWPQI